MIAIGIPKKEYKTKKTVVYSCQYHVIWTTKYRRDVLTNEVQERLRELILDKQEELDYNVLELEFMPDHVHMLIDLNPNPGVHTIIGKIKGYTSHVLREEFKHIRSRIPTLWTRSKFISTVGSVSLAVVKQYIEDQKK